MEVDWSLDSLSGTALVTVTVTNPTAVERRVRVDNRLDGPVLPPRREGVPATGWDRSGYDGAVAPNDRVVLGYACPAEPVRPPVEVADLGRFDPDDDPAPAADAAPAPASVVRALGDPAPPPDAVPVAPPGSDDDAGRPPEVRSDAAGSPPGADDASSRSRDASTDHGEGVKPDAESEDAEGDTGSRNGEIPSESAPREDSLASGDEADETTSGAAQCSDSAGQTDTVGSSAPPAGELPTDSPRADAAVPAAVEAWLDDVERRVARGEALTGASVSDAATVVADLGGVDAVEPLADRLDADPAALRALAERADLLADRAEATDVPAAALRRLA